MDFVTFFSDLGPMDVVKRLGLVVMHGVFVLVLVRLIIQFLRDGKADFFTPLLHYIIGILCIAYLPEIGKTLVQVTRGVSEVIYADQNITQFLTTENTYYNESEESPIAAVANFLNGKTYVRFIARMFILGMIVLKIVLIDIVWQVFFAMTTMLGAISIPISLMYGGNALATWLKSLIELMLWPIIYSLLMLIMNSIIMDGEGFIISTQFLEEDVKRICACWAIIVLTVLTPLLARSVMNTNLTTGAAEQSYSLVLTAAAASGAAAKTVAADVNQLRKKLRRADRGGAKDDGESVLNKR